MLTCLFCDDHQAILGYAQVICGKAKIILLTAISAEVAILIFTSEVDVLVSDITLGGGIDDMDGTDLARRLLLLKPALRVILTSGYPCPVGLAFAYTFVDKCDLCLDLVKHILAAAALPPTLLPPTLLPPAPVLPLAA